ncbi:hydroxysqualene dehydroxylase HpnE [Limnohabitans sp.]|uniref:hydroxysqualene dehydroxylase HpnE n=1 Tax=Limnohabitans sp. TaxID=1907725 RepID=UPI00286F6185|nr:hydroxysqualene dehydroxylase HpnE [Limnohabitans sp.]
MTSLTIVGAGWAGLAAAVAATQAGWQVTLYEATPIAGGRARNLPQHFAHQALDNGQHVLIGAYRDTLALMRTVGLDPEQLLHRLPLDVRFADGQGLHLPDWPMPLNLLAGIAHAQGWQLGDKASLFQACWRWQRAAFTCHPTLSVAQLCHNTGVSPRAVQQLIEPLCLSALNTPSDQASACVFLRVLHDALLGGPGSADLLVPRVDLGALLPDACVSWLQAHGVHIHLNQRIHANALEELHLSADTPLLLACPAWEAARLTAKLAPTWAASCADLAHTAIATVYLHCTDTGYAGLPRPMVALHSGHQAPAQFVFDRGALTRQPGLLAVVVSACTATRDEVAPQVQAQIQQQLGLKQLHVVQTVVEKRATLACTPALQRPDAFIAPRLWACGDYISGPYPSTLEGAVRSGQQVVAQLRQMTDRQGLS